MLCPPVSEESSTITRRFSYVFFKFTPLKKKHVPWNQTVFKGNVIVQPSIFRGRDILVFGGVECFFLMLIHPAARGGIKVVSFLPFRAIVVLGSHSIGCILATLPGTVSSCHSYGSQLPPWWFSSFLRRLPVSKQLWQCLYFVGSRGVTSWSFDMRTILAFCLWRELHYYILNIKNWVAKKKSGSSDGESPITPWKIHTDAKNDGL